MRVGSPAPPPPLNLVAGQRLRRRDGTLSRGLGAVRVSPGSSGHTHPLSARFPEPPRASGPEVRSRSFSRHLAGVTDLRLRSGAARTRRGGQIHLTADEGVMGDGLRRETEEDCFI
ncbi:hypothetical protein HispidOSU_024085 [Sigmodon hispidus]